MQTDAESRRQALEDQMTQQALLQAAARKQQGDAINRAQAAGDARSANELSIAQMQVNAAKEMEASRAAREDASNRSLMDRQMALAKEGKGMSEYEQFQKQQVLDAQADDPVRAAKRRLANKLGTAPSAQPSSSSAAPAATATVKPTAVPATPYDATGFGKDVGYAAERAAAVRGDRPDIDPGEMPVFNPNTMQGAAVRDANGVLRQVYNPSMSSSATPDRATMAAKVKQQMMADAAGPSKLQVALNSPSTTVAGAPKPTAAGPAPAAAPAPEALPFDQKEEDDKELLHLPHSQAYQDYMAKKEKVKGREASGDETRRTVTEGILKDLMSKPVLTPVDQVKLNKALGDYASAGYGDYPGSRPRRISADEYTKPDVEAIGQQAETAPRGWLSGVSNDAVASVHTKIQELQNRMRDQGFSGTEINHATEILRAKLEDATNLGGRRWSYSDVSKAVDPYTK